MSIPIIAIACLIEIVNIPVVMPLPVHMDTSYINDYRIDDTYSEQYTDSKQLRMIHRGDYPWIRKALIISSLCCYVASVSARIARNKLLFMVLGAFLSYGLLIF